MDANSVNCLTRSLASNENGWRDSRCPDWKMDEHAALALID